MDFKKFRDELESRMGAPAPDEKWFRENYPYAAIDLTENLYGHPDPIEAWEHMPKSEQDAGYATTQMMEAYWACSPYLHSGDLQRARMMFLESYRAQIARAIDKQQKPEFVFVYPTHNYFQDRLKRLYHWEMATKQAVERKWLTAEQSAEILKKIQVRRGLIYGRVESTEAGRETPNDRFQSEQGNSAED